MIKNKIITITVLTLVTGVGQARIDHSKYHDYRNCRHNAELQSMQDYHLKQALNKINRQEHKYAWGDLAYLLCNVPNHHQALQHMLRLAPELNKVHELQEFLTTAIRLFPNDPVVHLLYGAHLNNLGESATAEEHMQIAQGLGIKDINSKQHYHADTMLISLP